MTDDLVTRIRTVFEDTPEVLSTLDVETYAGAEAHTHMLGMWETMKEAADYIEALEKRGLVLEDYIRGLLTVVDDLEKVLEHFRGRIREMEGTK